MWKQSGTMLGSSLDTQQARTSPSSSTRQNVAGGTGCGFRDERAAPLVRCAGGCTRIARCSDRSPSRRASYILLDCGSRQTHSTKMRAAGRYLDESRHRAKYTVEHLQRICSEDVLKPRTLGRATRLQLYHETMATHVVQANSYACRLDRVSPRLVTQTRRVAH